MTRICKHFRIRCSKCSHAGDESSQGPRKAFGGGVSSHWIWRRPSWSKCLASFMNSTWRVLCSEHHETVGLNEETFLGCTPFPPGITYVSELKLKQSTSSNTCCPFPIRHCGEKANGSAERKDQSLGRSCEFICHSSAFVGLQRILFFLEAVSHGILPVNL